MCKCCGRGSKQIGTHKRHEKLCFSRKQKRDAATEKEIGITDNISKANLLCNEKIIKIGELWYCKECDKTGKQKINLVLHAEIHISGLSFDCPYCEEKFVTRTRLATHKTEKHSISLS